MVPVVLISGRTELPPTELAFVDAHFGHGTSLDDLLWTMRILAPPRLVPMTTTMTDHVANHQADRREITQWADST